MRKEKKRIIQKNGSSNLLVNQLVNSSVKNICICFVTITRKDGFPKRSVLVRSCKEV